MTQMNLSMKQKQNHGHREQTGVCQGRWQGGGGRGMDWEFGISRCKLLHIGWVNNKVLLYSIGNYIQCTGINHNGKEYTKKNIYTHICVYIYTHMHIYTYLHIFYWVYFPGEPWLICWHKADQWAKGEIDGDTRNFWQMVNILNVKLVSQMYSTVKTHLYTLNRQCSYVNYFSVKLIKEIME